VFNVVELADPLILAQKGESSTSSLFPTLIRDTQDNRFRPTQGGVSGLRGQLAGGPLGGENSFYRFFLGHRQYYPVWTDRVIAMGNGQIGYADGFAGKELPAFERLFLGGARTVRGFDFREVGPKDAEGRPLGGHASLLFNFELQFPFIAGLRAVAFFDAGQVYQKHGVFDPTELRTSAGAGLRILSPLGPISMDWGFKLDPRPGESASEFHFSIGQLF
jgi:outer membrane protein insertion porin family